MPYFRYPVEVKVTARTGPGNGRHPWRRGRWRVAIRASQRRRGETEGPKVLREWSAVLSVGTRTGGRARASEGEGEGEGGRRERARRESVSREERGWGPCAQ